MIWIVTDTQANLPRETADAMGIAVMHSYVWFGREKLKEGVDISDAGFYERLATSEEIPTTTPPTVEDFLAAYRQIITDDADAQILSVHVSSKLSECLQNATQAAQEFEDKRVTVFDTLTASVAEGLLVYQAAKMAQTGSRLKAIIKELTVMREQARIFFLVDSVKYLASGGRIGGAAYLAQTEMSVKPMLTVHEGEITGYARFTERSGALKNLKALVKHVARGRDNALISTAHAMCQEEANSLNESIMEELTPEVLLTSLLSPATGTHTGPGTLAVGWYVPEG
nr:DegV family protein [Anaerolineae bacterium]